MITRLPAVRALCCTIFLTGAVSTSLAEDPDQVIDLWPSEIPGPLSVTRGEEGDTTGDDGQLIAGERVIRTGNVSTPQMHVYLPPAERRNGTACVVCPGGGFSILAWDLEGTEVADWLTSRGIAAIVLKYRVPTRQHGWPDMVVGPASDAQRALSLTRLNAEQWQIDPNQVGVLGFSAGGATAAFVAVKGETRLYEAMDPADEQSCRADYAVLVYPGAIVDRESAELREEFADASSAPPTLLIHAADDPVNCENSIAFFQVLRKHDRSAELHIYNSGGHGYGLRRTDKGVTTWPARATGWLEDLRLLKRDEH